MKHKTIRILSIALCAVLLTGTIGTVAVANSEDRETRESQPDEYTTLEAPNETETAKNETVYVIAGADGTVQKIIVSDWLRNNSGIGEIEDRSDIPDIENVKGDESYTPGGDNTRVWDAQGKDIYYQGNIEKELPVNLRITYFLDGIAAAPEELEGKSGRVTIRVDYQNNQYEMVEIDGKYEKIYVPFAMLTGFLLDNDVFTNVEVTNGKIINDGDRTAVVGIALPGLQEDLNISKDKLEIPSFVEITADVTDFKLGMSVTIATNEIFSGLNVDELDSVGDLTDSMDKLTDAMDQLIDGSSELYNGLCTLLDKSEALVDGIDKLATGALALKNGASELDSGASQLQSGAAALHSGLLTLNENSDALNSGATQVFNALLLTAQTQLSDAGIDVPALTISNYAEVLNSVIASVDETAVYGKALSAVTEAVEAQRGYIRQQVAEAVEKEVYSAVSESVREAVKAGVTAAVRDEITPKVMAAVRESVAEQVIAAATGMDMQTYNAAVASGLVDEATQAYIKSVVDEKMESDECRQLIENKVEEQLSTETIQSIIADNTAAKVETDETKATIETLAKEKMASDEIQALIEENTEAQIEKAISENMASEAVQSQLAAASEGAQKIITLKASLDSFNAFYIGLQSYTAGVSEAASGAGRLKGGIDNLKEGTSSLHGGAAALYDGILTIQDGMPKLIDGITELRDGSMKISDGLQQFNEDGIQKLVEAFDGDFAGLKERLDAIIAVSQSYRNYSGIADGMDGQVKFIYRTEGIGE